MTIEQILISAINNKVSLAVDYDHHIRLISPVRYGWKTTDKKVYINICFVINSEGRAHTRLLP